MSDIYSQIKCVKREISMRKRVYPRMVMTERLTPAEAEAEIKTMEAVLKTLEELASPPLFKEDFPS